MTNFGGELMSRKDKTLGEMKSMFKTHPYLDKETLRCDKDRNDALMKRVRGLNINEADHEDILNSALGAFGEANIIQRLPIKYQKNLIINSHPSCLAYSKEGVFSDAEIEKIKGDSRYRAPVTPARSAEILAAFSAACASLFSQPKVETEENDKHLPPTTFSL